jgi:penicillin-binding protein 1A
MKEQVDPMSTAPLMQFVPPKEPPPSAFRPSPRTPSPKNHGPRLKRYLKRALLVLVGGLVAAVAIAGGTYAYFDRGLPSVDALRNYQPPQVTKVYCSDGSVCAEFFRERRTVVPLGSLPPHVRNAFLAAEDADFYKHEGLDYIGMARAALKSLTGSKQGASTITQQAVKNLLLTQERTVARKIREWILTPRLERSLSKDQILSLYLNAIYFGHGRYGIEEAALFYFGKHAKDLSLGEAATLAGIPKHPQRINPVNSIVKAKARQRYVLSQLASHGFVPRSVIAAELDKPIVLAPRPPPQVGLYYAEELRRQLAARYGDEKLLSSGLRIDIAMQPKLQAAAEKAVQDGLEAVDRRQGYAGPLGHLEPARFNALAPLIAQRITEAGKRAPDEQLVADLTALSQQAAPSAVPEEGAEERSEALVEGEAPPTPEDELARRVALKPLRPGVRLAGYVSSVDDAKKVAEVDLIGRKVRLPYSALSWARRRDVAGAPAPTKVSDVVKPGDLVRVRIAQVSAAPAPLEGALDQVPSVQGALVVIDPATRYVVAMVGGYDFAVSPFNRATQALRQPGSAFKPFLYAAALSTQRFTPLSIVNDAPEAIRDPYTGKTWKPQNYEKGGFEGPMTLRHALTKSKNTVSVRLIEAITPAAAMDFAKRAGIDSKLPDNLTLALGTGEVTVLELTNAYATLQSQGRYAEPITVVRVADANGTVLEQHQAAFEERLPPPVAYLATSLMRSVVEEGTATAVKELARPAAGKTGTASEFRDAWFAGYTADYVAAAWVGFDNHDKLGNGETGGKAALPIWLELMKAAHEELPAREFEVPPGIVVARVDPATGLLAGDAIPGRSEPFLEGTEPTETAPPPGQVSPDDIFLEPEKGMNP